MPFVKWRVFREPMELLALAKWRLDNPAGERALEYIRCLFGGILNTVGVENGFNDLRDNEVRAAEQLVPGAHPGIKS